ncbi:MAG: Gfo/Idh/MocA family oxidoreductase [Nitrospinota bacterium]|nr:Gfo/Idh/MocA family oxidoreductase [Nitrospinota bacterium]
MNEKSYVGFALLGCGLMGDRHAQVICAHPNAKLITSFDLDESRGKAFSEKFGCLYFPKMEEAIAGKDVDAVLIATPSYLHANQAFEAGGFGKHVLIEKPLAIDLESCESLIRFFEEKKLILSVVSQKRFHPAVQSLKIAIGEGLLGDIFLAEISINYHRDEHYFLESPWRSSGSESGGGVLMNQGIHYLDLLLWFLGPHKRISGFTKTVRPNYDEEDVAVGIIELSSGALGVVTASTVTFPNSPEKLSLYGTRGSCTFVEGKGMVNWSHKEEISQPTYEDELEIPSIISPKLFSMYRNHSDFVESILLTRETKVPARESMAVVKLVKDFYKHSS